MVSHSARPARHSLLCAGRRSDARAQDRAEQTDHDPKREHHHDHDRTAISCSYRPVDGPTARSAVAIAVESARGKRALLLVESILVAARKVLVPFPCAFDDCLKRFELRPPAQLALDFLRRGDESRRIAGPPRFFKAENPAPADLAATLDYLAHT